MHIFCESPNDGQCIQPAIRWIFFLNRVEGLSCQLPAVYSCADKSSQLKPRASSPQTKVCLRGEVCSKNKERLRQNSCSVTLCLAFDLGFPCATCVGLTPHHQTYVCQLQEYSQIACSIKQWKILQLPCRLALSAALVWACVQTNRQQSRIIADVVARRVVFKSPSMLQTLQSDTAGPP